MTDPRRRRSFNTSGPRKREEPKPSTFKMNPPRWGEQKCPSLNPKPTLPRPNASQAVGEVVKARTETASETVAKGPVVVVLKAEETNLVESGLRTSREKTGLEWSTTTRRPTS